VCHNARSDPLSCAATQRGDGLMVRGAGGGSGAAAADAKDVVGLTRGQRSERGVGDAS